MKTCWECGGELQVIKDKPYHYRESGLDNVYLYGVIQYQCRNCNEGGPEIPKIEELHLLIGREIVCRNSRLTAKEITYLRKELGLKSKEMAELLSVTPQAYSKWENSKPISPVYDSQLRLLYILNADYKTGKVLHDGIRFIQKVKPGMKASKPIDKIEISAQEWMRPLEEHFFCECGNASKSR